MAVRDGPLGNDNPSESQARLEAAEARLQYDAANRLADEIMKIVEELGLDHPDGRAALTQAIRVQRYATKQYTDAVRGLTQWILKRKLS
jgi:hypothetical protein